METLRDIEIVRALAPGSLELRAAGDGLGVMNGHFSVFNQWYEINSFFEGNFLERIAPGAFKKTIAENGQNMRVMFDHGHDPQIGNKVLGVPETLREDQTGAYYEVPLFDTSYNRDLQPGLAAGAYGSSFRFRAIQDSWNDEPGISSHNPKGIPERTITETRTVEFGPVAWPANPGATAGIRSLTDEFYSHLRQTHPDEYDELVARAQLLRTPELPRGTAGVPGDDGAAPQDPQEPRQHSSDDLTLTRCRRMALAQLRKVAP